MWVIRAKIKSQFSVDYYVYATSSGFCSHRRDLALEFATYDEAYMAYGKIKRIYGFEEHQIRISTLNQLVVEEVLES